MSLLDTWKKESGSPKTPTSSSAATGNANPFAPLPSRASTTASPSASTVRTTQPNSLNPFSEQPSASSRAATSTDQLVSNSSSTPSTQQLAEDNESSRITAQDTAQSARNDKPRFSLRQKDFRRDVVRSGSQSSRTGIHGETQIIGIAASSGMVAIATTGRGCSVIRWKPGSHGTNEVSFSHRTGDMIHRVFINRSGSQLFVSLNSGDNYLLSSNVKKALGALTKLKGVLVDSVAWLSDHNNPQKKSDSLTTLLIGTSTGKIMECAFDGMKERYVKELYVLNETLPICGLAVERFVERPGEDYRYFVMAVTGRRTRCYQFTGGPSIEALFQAYPGSTNVPFWELPGFIHRPELHMFSKTEDGTPSSFSILTEEGIFHGNIQLDSNMSEVTTERKMLFYPQSNSRRSKSPPIAMCEMEHHFILLYPTCITVIHKVSEDVTFEEDFSEYSHDRLIDMAYDRNTKCAWITTSKTTYQFSVADESIDMWRRYMNRASSRKGTSSDFSTALQYCITEEQTETVLRTKADYLLAQDDFEGAALAYAQTKVPFEKVSLSFIKRDQQDALRIFLSAKLESIPSEQRTKRTILATWLLELYLHRLNRLRKISPQDTLPSNESVDESSVQTELWSFLVKYKDVLEPVQDLVFELMTTHGREEELLFYAECVNEYGRILEHYHQRGDYEGVLRTLAERIQDSQEDPATSSVEVELFYKYAVPLMEHLPKNTVDLWMNTPQLKPNKLLPALTHYTEVYEGYARKLALRQRLKPNNNNVVDIPISWRNDQGGLNDNQAIRFLEYCIYDLRSRDTAVHNMLLSLYTVAAASKQDTTLSDPLIRLLGMNPPLFDQKFALRVCYEARLMRACVLIKASMDLLEDAVEMALGIDVDLAKQQASRAKNVERERKLWLRIARHYIDNNKDVESAVSLVSESNALKIEHVLPYCPDFAVIDDLKGAIIESLEDYNENIESLKGAMQEVTESADLIRQDIKELGNKFTQIAGSQSCDLCSQPVLSREFYAFPCTHAFHCNCLYDEVIKHVDDEQRLVLEALKRKAETSTAEELNGKGNVEEDELSSPEGNVTVESPAQTLDSFISASCPFCGDLMIQSIAEPFLTAEDLTEAKEWNL